MKKTKILTLVAASVLLALASCKPTDDPQQLTKDVVVTTTEPTHISGTTAVCGAEVTAKDAGLLLELGVCWSQSENPTIDDQTSKTSKCSQPYQCFLMDLEPNTKYHVRGFAKYGTEYCYGDEKTFTTLADTTGTITGLLTTTPAFDITSTGFTAGGTLAPIDINLDFRFYGICFSTSPTPVFDDDNQFVWDYYYYNANPFQIYVYGLEPNTQYYYRAFLGYGAQPPYSIIYGDILSVTTPEIPFMLEIQTYLPYYSWTGHWIEAVGYMNCTRPEWIDQVGFCYSTENEYPQFESDLHTTVASPLGEWYDFNSYINDVSANKKYYIRSYARYMTDSIKYGNVVSIDTY